MNINELIQSLEPGRLIELFELDISSITGTNTPSDHYYMHSGLSDLGFSIVWQTKTYAPFPIEATGFEMTTKGTMPRPTVRVSNVTGAMSALCDAYGDLVGAKFIRRQTFARYLDGQPEADPDQHLPDDVFYVERKTGEDLFEVAWELVSAMDLEGVQLPSRVITVDYCTWDYRSTECSYAGSNYFDVNGNPVASLALDVCSKALENGCKKRFPSGPIPFGGFPAAKAYRL